MTSSRPPGQTPTDRPDPAAALQPVAPGPVASEPRTDTSPAALRAAIHDDLVLSATRRRAVAGERVVRTARWTAYLSGLASPDMNIVAETRFGAGDVADRAIAETIAQFDGRPFLWWVGEQDTPADLGDRLSRAGVGFIDDVTGMAMDLADLADPSDAPGPAELRIAPVLVASGLEDYHAVLRQSFPEDFVADGVDAAIAESSVRLAVETNYHEPDGLPTHWIGTVDGTAVTTTRLHTAAGVSGIYAVVTAEHARRRGYGEAITRHVLGVVRDAGYRIAVLQASPAGHGVYERIGFRDRYRYRLHEWRPTPTT